MSSGTPLMVARVKYSAVFIYDMGFVDLAIMGSKIRTPNIEKLPLGGVLTSPM